MVIQRKIQLGFAVALVFLVLAGLVTWWSARRNVEAFRAVDHTYQVIARLQDTLVEMLNTETGARGFALSGDDDYLSPYQTGSVSVKQAFAAAQQLTKNNPVQQQQLVKLWPLIQKRIALADGMVIKRRNVSPAEIHQPATMGEGKQTMDEIRKVIGGMQAEEERAWRQRTEKAQSLSHWALVIASLGSLVAIVLVSLAGGVVQRDFRKRREAEEERDRFFTLSLDLLCISQADGFFKRVNPAFTTALGWSLEEMLARPFIELVHPDDRDATLREVEQQVVAGQSIMHFENRYQHKDGSWRWLSWKSIPQPGGLMYATARDITEIKRTEESLRQAQAEVAREQARLQFIFDNVPVGIALTITDSSGRKTRLINTAHLRICGLTREQVSEPDAFHRITHPEDLARQVQFDRQIEAGTLNQYSLDKRYLQADGTVIWVEFAFLRQRFAGGGYEALSIVVDITERKRMEQTLRRSEENLSVTLQSIGDAVMTTDAAGRVTGLNPVAEKLTGWTHPEALGRPVDEVFCIINEETRRPAVIPVASVLATGEIQGLANHTAIIARDGSERPIADSAAPIRDKEGKVFGVVLVFRDMTEEKKKENEVHASKQQLERFNDELAQLVEQRSLALQESERLARAALDALTAHVAILDEHGIIIATNQSWQNFANQNGLPSAQAGIGTNYLEICEHATGQPATPATKMAEGIRAVITGQKDAFTLEYDCHSPTEKRWFLCRVTRFAGAGNVRVVVAHENITQMRLLERQQVRSQRLESLGTLAGGMAHDFNNALSPIMVGIQLLKERYPDESEIVDMFYVSAKRGSDMVRQLLTFARGAEGERSPVEVKHLVREMEKIVNGSFPKNIRLTVEYDQQLPSVLGDATQIHQIILNLCVNARDAMPEGGTLTLTAHLKTVDAAFAARSVAEARPGKFVALRVQDTGTGIPPDVLDRIFDPFFTTKAPGKGTGLGLSTVVGIVKGHGGFVKVYSQPGQGTTFTVFLPANESSENGDSKFAVRATDVFKGSGETVLVVDDEPAIRQIISSILRRMNLIVVTAADGTEGLAQLASHRGELRAIITDLHMPNMGGLEFVRQLRQVLPDIPVVVTSGRMDKNEEEQFKAMNVETGLLKPFTEGELATVLHKLLNPK